MQTSTHTAEGLLRELSSLRDRYGFSCDIYHDDDIGLMVVRLSTFTDGPFDVRRFKGDNIADLLLDALNYVSARRKRYLNG